MAVEGPVPRPGSSPLLFGDLFYGLRQAGLKVGPSEWMALMEALSKGVIAPDLTAFYHAARAVLIKDEAYFDTYDEVFAAVFADGTMPRASVEEVLKWLAEPKPRRELDEEALAALEALELDELRRLFEERLKEQDKRHDGGNKWIGTGGTSPFGQGGTNPAGVRVGGGGGNRTAVQIATQRLFQSYRDDRVLDTRSLAVALRKLRRLGRHEGEPELDVEASIDATCKNAGELELVLQPPRKNQARVLLLMDVGGSMDPFAAMVEKLFSAASNLNAWRKFQSFTFHNCVYESLYSKHFGHDGTPTGDVLRDNPAETFLIIVGDASMAPSELLDAGGAIDYWHRNQTPGIVWMHRLRTRFQRTIWLNPMPKRWWRGYTVQQLGTLFPMFELTVRGLQEGVEHLMRRTPPPVPPLDPRLGL